MVNDSILFAVSTQAVMNGRDLRGIKPDANGVYRGIPLTVITTKPSRNGVWYTEASVIKQINDVQGRFNKFVREGNLEGEYCHPLCLTKEDLPRLTWIDRTKKSHYFTNIYAKALTDGTGIVIYGDVVPDGPYGQYMQHELEDPKRNCSFSFRAVARVIGSDGATIQKELVHLITFDGVDGPGYEYACKRYQDKSVAMESWRQEVNLSIPDFVAMKPKFEAFAMESFNDCQELKDIFRTNEISVRSQVTGVYDPRRGVMLTKDGNKSLFATAFGK